MSFNIKIHRRPNADFCIRLRLRAGEPAVVEHIDRDSAAFRGGMKIGDTVVRINTHSTSSMTSVQLEELFSRSEQLHLVYSSGGSEVIDLLGDSDEEIQAFQKPRRIKHPEFIERMLAVSSNPRYRGKTFIDQEDSNPNVEVTPVARMPYYEKKEPCKDETVSSGGVSTDDPVGGKRAFSQLGELHSKASAKRRREKGLVIKEEFPSKSFGESNSGDDVVGALPDDEAAEPSSIIRPSAFRLMDDDDFAVLEDSVRRPLDMPHQREGCSRFPFKLYPVGGAVAASANLPFCAHCYCYVCEVLAADCVEWELHCNATCKLQHWQVVQQIRKLSEKFPAMRLLTTRESRAQYQSEYRAVIANFPRGDSTDEHAAFVDRCLKRWRELVAEVGNHAGKFAAAVVLLARAVENARMDVRYLFKDGVNDCALHLLCTADMFRALKEALGTLSGVDGLVVPIDCLVPFYTDSPTVAAPTNWHPLIFAYSSKMNGFVRKFFLRMAVGDQDIFLKNLKTVEASVGALFGLAYLKNSLSDAHQQVVLVKRSISTLSRGIWPNSKASDILVHLASCRLTSDLASEQDVLMLLAALVDDLTTDTVPLPPVLIVSLFQLALSFVNRQTYDELFCRFLLHLYQNSLDMRKILLLPGIHVTTTVRIVGCCLDIRKSSGSADECRYIFAHLSLSLGKEVLLSSEYSSSGSSSLPASIAQELCRLPCIHKSSRHSQTTFDVHLHPNSSTPRAPDLVLPAASRDELLHTLLTSTLSTYVNVFGHYASFGQLTGALIPLLGRWINAKGQDAKRDSIMRDMWQVKFMWKSLLLSIYKTIYACGANVIIDASASDLPCISSDVLSIVSDPPFVAAHGIESFSLLWTFHLLVNEKRPHLVYAKMVRSMPHMVSGWDRAGLSTSAISNAYLLDAVADRKSLHEDVTTLYKRLICAHIEKFLPPRNASDKFLLALAEEDWESIDSATFRRPEFMLASLLEVDIDSFGWTQQSVDANIRRFVSIVEESVTPVEGFPDVDLSPVHVNSLAFLVINQLSLPFVLTFASVNCPALVARLSCLYAEGSLKKGHQEELGRIESKINTLLSDLPESYEALTVSSHAERIICVCAYLGRFDVCLDKYEMDAAKFNTLLGKRSRKVLSMVLCHCPFILLEKLIHQLLPILCATMRSNSNDLESWQCVIATIEDSVQYITVPGQSDRFRREVLFYHHRSLETLENVLAATNREPRTVVRLQAYLQSVEEVADWTGYLDLLHKLLGDDGFCEHLLSWKLSETLDVGSVATAYKRVIQLIATMPNRDKALVFLMGILYMDKAGLLQACLPSDIPLEWLLGMDAEDSDTWVVMQVRVAKALILLRQDQSKAEVCISALLKHEVDVLVLHKPQIACYFKDNLCPSLQVSWFFNLREYEELFAFIKSLVFSPSGPNLLRDSYSKAAAEALGRLNSELNADIFPIKDHLALNALDSKSFLFQLFDFTAHVHGCICSCSTFKYNASMLKHVDALLHKVQELAGPDHFVKDFLNCAVTQMESYTPALLQHENEAVGLALQRDCKGFSNDLKFWSSEHSSLENVMIATVAKCNYLHCKLKVLKVLFHLKSGNANDSPPGKDLQTFVRAILKQPSFVITFGAISLRVMTTIRLRTSTNDDKTPQILVDILSTHGQQAASVLEMPILEALSGSELIYSNGEPTALSKGTDKKPMVINKHWRHVCLKMSDISQNFQYFKVFGDLDKDWLALFKRAYLQHDIVEERNSLFVISLYEQLLIKVLDMLWTRLVHIHAGLISLIGFLCEMWRDVKTGKVTLLKDFDFAGEFERKRVFDCIVDFVDLPRLPHSVIAEVPELVQGCTFQLVSLRTEYVMAHSNSFCGFWGELISQAPHLLKGQVLKSVVKVLSALAERMRIRHMNAALRDSLKIFVQNFKHMLAAHRQEFHEVITNEIICACRFICSKKKVVELFSLI